MNQPLILLALLAGLIGVTVVSRRRRHHLGTLVFGTATLLVGWWIVDHNPGVTLAVLAPLAVVALVVAAVRLTRTASVVTRWGNRTRRTAGVATTLDIARVASAPAMRRKATVVRPSMQDLTRRERARVKTTEVAVPLARVGAIQVHASIEDVLTISGGPRTGKTGKLACLVIDHPGAVVTTSTRLDLLEITRPLRETGDRPVFVFNPGGLGDLPSTIGFDPLTGCADPVVATERAADMLPETEDAGSHRFWEGRASDVLAALMHAAALGGRSMQHVQDWVASPKNSKREVIYLLGRSPQPAFEKAFEQFVETNRDTQTSITQSISPALRWLTSPSAVAATTVGEAFDVAALLRDCGTVYMLGRHEAHTASLMAGLTGYIAREARRLAGGKRLDPPLGLYLDEAARVAPVPLPDWSGDFGGSGIFICTAIQSRADLVDRWGKTGAAKILNNSGAVMLFGGTKDAEDLEFWSRLAGDRDEVVKTYGKDGRVVSRSVRKVPVLSPSQLANLPAGRAVVYRRGMPPAVGRVQMAWKRRDVRAVARSARRVASPARPGVALPVPARVSPAAGVAQPPAPSPAVAPAREVAGVAR